MKKLIVLLVLAATLMACSSDSPTEPKGKAFEVSARVTDLDTGFPVTTATLDFSVNGDSEQNVVVDGDGWTKKVILQILGDTDPQEVYLSIRGGINYGLTEGVYPLTWEYNPREGKHILTAKVRLRRAP